jgi:CRISPR-associated protein Csb2
MSTNVSLSFPTGRFHATPWGHHVNEGQAEWPPSPWRLLRALVATWKRKLADDPQIGRALPGVLAQLAQQPPQFYLPPATLGHTRHYMPWYKKGPDDKTLVFDAFVCVSPGDEVVCHWSDVCLSAEGEQALARLLDQLGYLGRAESWATARLRHGFDPARVNCRIGQPNAHSESVRVLTADPVTWQAWGFKSKKVTKPDPPWNLLAETADMHQEKWSDPPGSKWELYARASDCFAPKPNPRPQRAQPSFPCTVARYVLDAPVLPLVAETLPFAEAARTELLRRCRAVLREQGIDADRVALAGRCPAVVGKTPDGHPLRGHGHTFYLPADEDGDGRLNHLTIMAPMGFNDLERQALDRLRRLTFGQGDPLTLMLVGLGSPADFRTPLLGPSAVWLSATPFVATRYPKLRGTKRDRPEDYATPQAFVRYVLRLEIRRRPDLPEVVAIEAVERIGRAGLRPIQFKRFRGKRGDDGGRRPAGAFRVVFARPVQGPLCLGHSCHFGLGLFLTNRDPSES